MWRSLHAGNSACLGFGGGICILQAGNFLSLYWNHVVTVQLKLVLGIRQCLRHPSVSRLASEPGMSFCGPCVTMENL